jgi:outer membrane protein OmpU
MKKIVLATTALVSVALAGPVLAQESMVMGPQGADASIGGYYEFRQTDYSEGDSASSGDTEIFISFSRVSESGLEFGVDWQLEAGTTTDNNTDEASMYVAGEFGRVVFGENDHAHDSFQTWAPTHAGSIGQDDATNFYDGSKANDFGGFAGNALYSDTSKIAYFSPNLGGFNFGFSWQDQGDDAEISVGGAYSQALTDNIDLTIRAASYDNGADGAAEINSLSYGATLALGDLTLTAANVDAENGSLAMEVENLTGVGIGYAISDELSVGAYFSEQGDSEWNSFSAEYIIAQGLSATVARNGQETNSTDASEVIFEIGVSF